MEGQATEKRAMGRSAQYGKACMQCFKSKCRCIARPDGNACERCYRLKKQCSPADSLRRRVVENGQNSSARITQLESKVDDLVSILQTVAKYPDASPILQNALDDPTAANHRQSQQHQSLFGDLPLATPPSTLPSTLPSTTNGTTPMHADDQTVPNSASSSLPTTASASSSGTEHQPNTSPFQYDPIGDEAEKYLDKFRSCMLPTLAFVHIPSTMTARKLHQERPFLLRAIVAVVSPSAQQKIAYGREVKQIVAQSILLENNSSIDLLLGLLTFLAWSFDHTLHRMGTLSRLMMLAMSLAYDLRLNKPLPLDTHMTAPYIPEFQHCDVETDEQTTHRSLERQRAVLGCYLLSSIISSYFAQIDAMRWTPRMEECLNAVGASKECPTDETFSLQVRLQLLAQRAVHAREQQEMDLTPLANAPLSFFVYTKALQLQLQEVRLSLSPGLQQQGIITIHMHYIEVCLNETAHTANSNKPLVFPTAATPNRESSMPSFERLECLWRSINAIRSWLDIFLAMPPSACVGLSFLSWAQFGRCLVTLYRLTILEDPAWDRQAVRNTVDLLLVLDHVAEKLELTSREAGEQSDDDLFRQLARMMRAFRIGITPRLAPEQVDENIDWYSHGTATGAGNNIIDPNRLSMIQSIDFDNERWFEEIMAAVR